MVEGVQILMKSRVRFAMLLAMVVVFTAISSAQLTSPAAGPGGTASRQAKFPSVQFEVASIKPHARDASLNGGWGFTADGFSATNLTLKMLIFYAYNLEMDDQLRGLPKWGDSDHWDIEARLDSGTAAAMPKLDREQHMAEMRLTVRKLLAARFGLTVREETRELPIYELVIAKSGSKLEAAKTGVKRSGWSSGDGRISGGNVGADTLAGALSSSDDVGRLVVDKTGLKGKYNFKLKWTPERRQESADSGPSIFTALQEQLGLKLVPAKGPVEVVVVDHVEPPTPN